MLSNVVTYRVHRALAVAVLLLAACGQGDAPAAITDAAITDAAITDAAVQGHPAPAADADAGVAEVVAREAGADAAAEGGGPAIAEQHHRGDVALERMLLSFWNGNEAYLNDASPAGGGLAGYWIFAQSFDALLDGVERSKGSRYLGLVETFYAAQDARGWTRDYYDDENWMALALLRASVLTGNTAYRDRAESLLADIMSAWDTTCCGAASGKIYGGIWWDRAHTQKATASNAGPVILAARLSQATGKPSYLAFAQQVYDYWIANMTDATTHEVADHITPDGKITRYKFTYNEGLVIGASLALSRASGDPKYLAIAHATAEHMLAKETASGVLFDGSNATCTGDCAQFKGIGFRYLAELYDADRTKSSYFTVLSTSADAIWGRARDPGKNLFSTDWSGPIQAKTSLDADSSATMALERFAALLGPRPPDGAAAGVIQAEDAVLHHIGLEARAAGFEGWGYIAGWNKDGQWVDFHVDVPTAGKYSVDLRYAAGAGNASRLLFVNGQDAEANHAFASTGAWTTYASTAATVTLPAGASTLSVIFDASKGSSNFLNLDRIRVAAAP